MREMHDGVGGHLVRTLSMLEGRGASREELAEELREALADMRLVIDSLDPSADDLATRLGMLRTRFERILARERVELVWRAEALPPLPHLGAEDSLHVLRIVQEAVTNVLRHAKATRLTLAARLAAGRGRRAGRHGRGVRRRRRHRRRRCPRARHREHATPCRDARSAARSQCREREWRYARCAVDSRRRQRMIPRPGARRVAEHGSGGFVAVASERLDCPEDEREFGAESAGGRRADHDAGLAEVRVGLAVVGREREDGAFRRSRPPGSRSPSFPTSPTVPRLGWDTIRSVSGSPSASLAASVSGTGTPGSVSRVGVHDDGRVIRTRRRTRRSVVAGVAADLEAAPEVLDTESSRERAVRLRAREHRAAVVGAVAAAARRVAAVLCDVVVILDPCRRRSGASRAGRR